MPQQTADLIALVMVIIVALVTVITAIALLYVSIWHPEQDIGRAAEAIGRIISVLIAALVGYMAGRRINGNGAAK